MLNFEVMQLIHRHDDGSVAPMADAGPHLSPAQEDEERTWLRGGRIFRCTQCNEEVVVGQSAGSAEPEDRRR